jgi:hypothetical protein
MSTPAASQVVRMPARLVASPTGSVLSGAFPYGGTALGETRDLKILYGFKIGQIHDEGFADEKFGGVRMSHGIVASCLLRAVDADAFSRVFMNSKVGTWNDRKVYEAPKSTDTGYKRPGSKWEDAGFKLLIAPFDEARHQFFVLYNALPVLDAQAEMNWDRSKEVGIWVGFHGACDTDATARRYDQGRMGSLAL